ncbi:hypothetical protein LZ009_06900 [Ramlibacter sp. XY19]|uniref:hypothetical protein n=1 Tax=Ramlibacter paludis TaxID=2908000 RepID=UPI0023DCE282|nr:hypothetical protein [Ramlibacter paludis]MCG2592509.1 hypothetical protein [Ramlibacter paludis]
MRRAGASLLLLAALAGARASTPDNDDNFDMSAANLLVVLRESPGANKQDETLEPIGKISARLPDGRVVEFEASWFQYLGDMHLRLVFDGLSKVQSALPGDLQKLKLSPQEALERAIDNLRARYGIPVVEPWTGGLMTVHGNAPELDSSYFLDRQFWLDTARDYPEGIVAAVPRSGGLVFARADDEEALTSLRFSAAALYAANERVRVSSALYLFKDGRWSVFQPAQQPAD